MGGSDFTVTGGVGGASSQSNTGEAKSAKKAPPAALTQLFQARAAQQASNVKKITGIPLPPRPIVRMSQTVTGKLEIHLDSVNISRLKQVSLPPQFADVESGVPRDVPVSGGVDTRASFLSNQAWKTLPPIISRSEFVPDRMVEHLMRDKKDSAIGVKYLGGDAITNMEGLMHTFVTPLGLVTLTGDYVYKYGHNATPLESGKGRPVVMSFAVQPDFEKPDVMLRLVEIKEEAQQGAKLPDDLELPSREDMSDQDKRLAYDSILLKHMIYHLTEDHQLPGLQDVQGNIMDHDAGMALLNRLIQDPDADIALELKGKVMEVNGYALSMEVLFNVYMHQMRNEFSALEAMCPQGYVYTMDPPAIFAQLLGVSGGVGSSTLNRFQTAALCHLNKQKSLENLKFIAFNDYRDKNNLSFLQQVFQGSDVTVCRKAELFAGQGGTYSGPSGLALVLHNNSDGFGQNIETEGLGSMDGVMGTYSDAACVVLRTRPDLTQTVV